MIRRRVGTEFLLITQHDHALLSAALARHVGGGGFAPLDDERALRAIALHDCGWPLHDDAPTLNRDALPIDVFETTPDIGLKVWTASADRATAEDPYTGLLVSLHVLSLSALATSSANLPIEKFDTSDARKRFEINRFQHRQIELQEQLRRRLGLASDQPLRLGLAEDQSDPAEQRLTYHFRLLQALDKVSLNLCCTRPPNPDIEPVLPFPGGPPLVWRSRRSGGFHLTIQPWPFTSASLSVDVPLRRLPDVTYPGDEPFRQAYAAAPVETVRMTLSPA